MDKAHKKLLMTDVAKGKLTMAQAEELMEPAQDDENNSEKEIIDDEPTAQKKKTHKRKKQLNHTGGK